MCTFEFSFAYVHLLIMSSFFHESLLFHGMILILMAIVLILRIWGFIEQPNTAWSAILLFIEGRHRWVEYASKDRYNASQVPPEWHGWLHYITDHTGDEVSLWPYPFKYFNFNDIKCKPGCLHIGCIWYSCSCWNRKHTGLNTKRTSLGREMNTSITRKDIPSIPAKETGQDTNPGNQRSPNCPYFKAGSSISGFICLLQQ